MSESQVFIVGPRQRGRPKGSEPTSPVSTRLPAKKHDVLIKWAAHGDESISALVRRIVERAIEQRKPR